MPPDGFRICPAATCVAQITPRCRVAEQMRAGSVYAELRQFGQGAGHAIQPPKPTNIGKPRHQRALALGLAEQRRQGRARRGRVQAQQRVYGARKRLIRATFGHEKQDG